MTFSSAQIEALKAPLNRANVKEREQSGRKVAYLESWWVEAEANEVFGFGNWSSEALEMRLVSERPRKIGKGQYEKDGWSVSYIAKVRVTVTGPDGQVIREGYGAGHGIDADVGLAHESASKEAASDAEKRCLKTFGNRFGLALYDKTQANVVAEPGALEMATGFLRGAADRGGEDFKETWGKNKDGWKELLSASDYATLVATMRELAKRFATQTASDPKGFDRVTDDDAARLNGAK